MNEKLRVLDLFSGIGGFSLGLERTGGFRTVAFCEIEPYCRAVLKNHWPDVPCFEDVRKVTAADVGPVDVICGGYPCQPFSVAGKRMGAEDDRHLWPEYFRIVKELRPAWVFGENVAGHVNMGLDDVLSDLEGEGYATRAFVIPACAADAKHRRDRVWIVAHSEKLQRDGGDHNGGRDCVRAPSVSESGNSGDAKNVARPSSGRCARPREPIQRRISAACVQGQAVDALSSGIGQEWCTEPNVGRVAYGVPSRVDRLKSLGNAVVPQIPEIIGQAILQAEGMT